MASGADEKGCPSAGLCEESAQRPGLLSRSCPHGRTPRALGGSHACSLPSLPQILLRCLHHSLWPVGWSPISATRVNSHTGFSQQSPHPKPNAAFPGGHLRGARGSGAESQGPRTSFSTFILRFPCLFRGEPLGLLPSNLDLSDVPLSTCLV